MAVIMIVDQVQADHPAATEVEIVVMEEVHQVAIEAQVAVMAAVKVVVVIVMTHMVTAVVAVMVAANVTHMRHQAVMEDTIIQVMEEVVVPDMAHDLLVV